MENKEQYYTPDISDLHVGYECEKLFVGEYITEYRPYIIKAEKSVPPSVYKTSEGEINNYAYRTPYLTKEQIEEEGWKFVTELCTHGTEDNPFAIEFEKEYNNEIKFYLQYPLKGTKFITISIVGGYNFDSKEIRFKGEVKSKNELKKLMKFLKITF